MRQRLPAERQQSVPSALCHLPITMPQSNTRPVTIPEAQKPRYQLGSACVLRECVLRRPSHAIATSYLYLELRDGGDVTRYEYFREIGGQEGKGCGEKWAWCYLSVWGWDARV